MAKTYVCFLWNNGTRDYKPEHVNLWANALKYWDKKCDPVCITDETKGFNSNVRVIPIPKDAQRFKHTEAPQGKQFPSSYRRLWLFSDEAKSVADRLMLLDIDCLILGDLSPLWDIDSDFVGWKPITAWGREDRIAGGTWLVKTGKLGWLWDSFIRNPDKIIKETKAMGWNGSDQAIMSRFLGNRYPVWPQRSGIYAAQDDVMCWQMPPKDSKIVHFNGKNKMWHPTILNGLPWVRAYYNRFRDE